MNLEISGKHVDLGEALKNHIQEKLEKAIGKYFGNVVDAQVTIGKDNHNFFRANIDVHVGHNIYIRAEESADDAHIATDKAVHIIEKNLRRYKKKLKAHHTRQDDSIEHFAHQYVLGGDAWSEEEVSVEAEPTIISESVASIPTLSVSNAVMRMDLENVPVYLFRNDKSGDINAVYSRKDGNIGWVNPKPKRS
jgi:ribosomal subunit interface protein